MAATRRTITVSVTLEQDALPRACLKSGRYVGVSEAMCAALCLLEFEEAAALAAIGPH